MNHLKILYNREYRCQLHVLKNMAEFFRNREFCDKNLGWIKFPQFEPVCLLNEVQKRILHDFTMAELNTFIVEHDIETRQAVPMERKIFRKNHCGSSGRVLTRRNLGDLLARVRTSLRLEFTKWPIF